MAKGYALLFCQRFSYAAHLLQSPPSQWEEYTRFPAFVFFTNNQGVAADQDQKHLLPQEFTFNTVDSQMLKND